MICSICKRETEGVRGFRRDSGIVALCEVCRWPKRYARCVCGRVKRPKSARCARCIEAATLKRRIDRAGRNVVLWEKRLAEMGYTAGI